MIESIFFYVGLIIFAVWVVSAKKKKPAPKKPMATRNEKRETAEFDVFISNMTLEDYEELEALIDEN